MNTFLHFYSLDHSMWDNFDEYFIMIGHGINRGSIWTSGGKSDNFTETRNALQRDLGSYTFTFHPLKKKSETSIYNSLPISKRIT
jgi:hypothetical protein